MLREAVQTVFTVNEVCTAFVVLCYCSRCCGERLYFFVR